jgi:predicted RNA-binding Zn-ribbon protein involved in translation (DUF1610 family)
MGGPRLMVRKTSSLTLPPYIEEKINALTLDDNLIEAVLALREAILETFYPVVDDRCPMCGGSGLYRYTKGKRTIEQGCDDCGGTGHTASPETTRPLRMALGIICGREMAPNDEIANMPSAELAAAILDGKILGVNR